jgi:hypothetical protein
MDEKRSNFIQILPMNLWAVLLPYLMNINLLKRLESSVYSFRLTLSRIRNFIANTINVIDRYDTNAEIDMVDLQDADFDLDDENSSLFTVGRKIKIALRDLAKQNRSVHRHGRGGRNGN